MKILAVNWLDRENPQAGGAELHFFEIFRRLVARGHAVTLVTSGFPGSAPRTTLDGIEVRRYARRYSFAMVGRSAIRRALREGEYDVVVEDINKLPLYTPTLCRLPIYVIVPHLFGTTAFREAPWPIATIVWLAEQPIPAIYRRARFHAISRSTRDDLVRRGVAADRIHVTYPGVDPDWFRPDPAVARTPTPTFLYVGRVKRYKGLETAVRAVADVRRRGCPVRLDIAGDGGDRQRLARLVRWLGLGEAVSFLGFVPESTKRTLLRQAWAVVFPSAKEGWGISNIEAAACGTPAVAADSPGLRESVRHEETGLLVPYGDVPALADAFQRLARHPEQVARLGAAARRFAETLSWDRTAADTETQLLTMLNAAPTERRGS
ncbi:MAG: glycosyltransferase family 4 protein [Gemmatimonadetes bacterium]|nr:glycosyltransferase family 4 protein [Gemmatimonadota bacterium]